MIEQNELAGARIAVSPRLYTHIYTVERVIESLFDMKDYISEKYWPEWKVTIYGDEVIVSAPTGDMAILKAEEIRYGWKIGIN
jgi:hypothetical protein